MYKTCPQLTVLLWFVFILNLENKAILQLFQSLDVILRSAQCSWVGTSRTHLGCQHRPKEDCHSSLKVINPIVRVLHMLNLQHFYSLVIFKNQLKKKKKSQRNYLQPTQAVNSIHSIHSHKVLQEIGVRKMKGHIGSMCKMLE